MDWSADERRARAELQRNAARIDSGDTAARDPRPAPRGAGMQGRLPDPERYCPQGHELTTDNTYYRRDGRAACQKCRFGL